MLVSVGHFDADYCPAVSGCRGLVLFEDDITETHSLVNLDNSHWYITFDNSEGHPLWMVRWNKYKNI